MDTYLETRIKRIEELLTSIVPEMEELNIIRKEISGWCNTLEFSLEPMTIEEMDNNPLLWDLDAGCALSRDHLYYLVHEFYELGDLLKQVNGTNNSR